MWRRLAPPGGVQGVSRRGASGSAECRSQGTSRAASIREDGQVDVGGRRVERHENLFGCISIILKLTIQV